MLISKFIDSFCYCKHEENKNILKVDINNNEESIPTNPQNEIIDKEKNVKENNQLCLAITVNNEGNDKEKSDTLLDSFEIDVENSFFLVWISFNLFVISLRDFDIKSDDILMIKNY